MHLRLSLTRGTSTVDREIVAEPGHTLGDLCDALPEGREALAAEVAGLVVGRDARVGLPPLLDGASVRLLGHDPRTTPTPAGEPAPSVRALLELHCVSGPDLGRSWPLPPGLQILGRGLEASIRLDDPECSRRHATVEVTTTGVRIHDPGATNGISVNGEPVGVTTALRLGDRLRIGSTTLVARTLDGPRLAAAPAGDGTLLVPRAPRPRLAASTRTVTFPQSPSAPPRRSLPLLAMLLPAVASGVLALVLRAPMMLAFGLLTPLLIVGSQISDRRASRRAGALNAGEYAAASSQAHETLRAALLDEETDRRHACPDLAERRTTARDRMISLWQNGSEDHLIVSVGRGDVSALTRAVVEGRPADVTGSSPASRDDDPPPPICRDVPLTIDLTDDPVVGVVGDPAARLALIGSMITQLCVGWGPGRLSVEIDATTPIGLDWTSWLPHARADRMVSSPGRQRLIVTATGERADLAAAATGTRPTLILAMADQAHELPAETTVVVTVGDAVVSIRDRDGTLRCGSADLPAAGILEEIARSLAPLREQSTTGALAQLPDEVSLGDLLASAAELAALDPGSVTARWGRHDLGLRAIIGADAHGPLALDLVRDGPHALVAGTTGAGKSELLTTLIASLAATHSPREVTFVLIDYKGGATLRACADLPHTVGFVTDLDGHLAQRALVSLGAEIKYREAALRASGSSTLAEHNRRADPLPRILIVIDEFRVLAEELPDFVAGVVQIASVGRSLGVSVVLATQRPAGVVTADIRANVGIRIALRVRDRADSLDVIDSPDAADLPAGRPGRALLATAERATTTFQTARVDLPPRAGRAPLRVLHPGPGGRSAAVSPIEAGPGGSPASELAAVVAATRAASAALALPAARTPWLPPLPTDLSIADLRPAPASPTHPGRSTTPLAIGLVDDPAHQRQFPLMLDLATAGNLAICGAPRSGRTTALRTIAEQATALHSPADLHLYAIHTGGLDALAAAPHAGVIARADDVDLTERLIALLGEETIRRRARAADSARSALALVLIDDWDVLTARLGEHRHGQSVEALHRLLAEGPAVGIVTVATGGRGLATGRAGGSFPERLMCRPVDLTDLYLLGIAASTAEHLTPPGRAVRASDGLIVQLARTAGPTGPSGEIAGSATASSITGAATPPEPLSPDRTALRIRRLPTRVEPGELPEEGGLLVGIGGPDCVPVGFDREGDRHLLVLGPAGSGRSSALAVIADRLRRAGSAPAVVAARRSVLTGSTPEQDLFDPRSSADRQRLIDRRTANPALVVLVDDAEDVAATPMADALAEVERLVDADRGLIVVATSPAALATRRCPLAQDIAVHRSGLLLRGCTSADADHLGQVIPIAPAGGAPAGRAYLARAGTALIAVQLAAPDRPEARDRSL